MSKFKFLIISVIIIILVTVTIFMLPKFSRKHDMENSLTVETVPNTNGYTPSTEESTMSYRDQVDYLIEKGETLIRQSHFSNSGIVFYQTENNDGELEVWVKGALALNAPEDEFIYLIYSPGEGIEGDGYSYLETLIKNYIPETTAVTPYTNDEILSMIYNYIDRDWDSYTGSVSKDKLKSNIEYDAKEDWFVLRNANQFIDNENYYEASMNLFFIVPGSNSTDDIPDNYNNLIRKLK